MSQSDHPSLEGFARYAIYYAPPAGGALDRFGEGWFGRAADGSERPRIAPPGLVDPDFAEDFAEDQQALTRDARRYGLHGTIKAPFRLAAGRTPEELDRALARFCAARPAARAPALRLSGALGFTSLRPGGPSPALDALAAAVVAAFAPFGAPPDEASLAKRRAAGLSRRQEAYLAVYGYPWVFEDFHFHITLSGRLPAERAAAVRAVLATPLSAVLTVPFFLVDALCLFGDPGDGAPFRLLRRHPLAPLR